MDGVIEFFVIGRPATGGSKSFMGRDSHGRAKIAPASKYTKPWRDSVAWQAMQKANRMIQWTCAVMVELNFYLKRPKGDFGTGRNINKLKPSAKKFPIGSMFDVDKLARSTLDALTGIIYRDDGQVCNCILRKRYVEPEHPYEGCNIKIMKMEVDGF